MPGGNLPDGVSQSDIDRAHDNDEEPLETIEDSFDKLEAQVDKSNRLIEKLRDENNRLRAEVESLCQTCIKYKGQMHPGHFGSTYCESGALAAGGTRSHCTCDYCF